MKFNPRFKYIFIEVVCFLYMLLFIYAGTSKLLDFENFRIQLGQSPLLSAFANWVSITVPVSELIIAIVLLLPKIRLAGLFAAYTLMVMFTSYIYIILHYSSFVPCSCGGILENMTWEEHLSFNIFFVALAGIAVVLLSKNSALINQQIVKP